MITGGAGYIGAHVVREMVAAGREVVVLDDLSTGRAQRLPAGVPLVVGSTTQRGAVRGALAEHHITAVMHFAARKQVGESVMRPLYYWEQNIGGMQVLLEEMVSAGISQMVFSSSAAVYGQPSFPSGMRDNPARRRIEEDTPCQPINPYGATKLAGEWMLDATAAAHGWVALSLRYFNVAGSATPDLGDPAVANLIPLVLQALSDGRLPKVYGDDYPTPDGSCIRDYIHVADLAAAHVAAARLVEASAAGQPLVHDSMTLEAARRAAEAMQSAAAHMPGASKVVGASTNVMESAVGRLRGTVASAAELAASAAEAAAMRNPVPNMPGGAVAAQIGSIVQRVSGSTTEPPLRGHVPVNIGTGQGYSVLEVIDALRRTVGRDFAVEVVDRRAGDPPALVASADRAKRLLGWRARLTLRDMTDSAYAAWQHKVASDSQ